jgi:hypothetical protein
MSFVVEPRRHCGRDHVRLTVERAEGDVLPLRSDEE